MSKEITCSLLDLPVITLFINIYLIIPCWALIIGNDIDKIFYYYDQTVNLSVRPYYDNVAKN